MGRLDGKRALISGTGGGIGRAAALLFAREGAHVVGCDLNPATSEETVKLARDGGGRMDAVAPADLATEEGARQWVDAAVDLAGGVDILVNNASAIRFGPIDTLSFADWSFTIRHELDIVFLCTQAAWPHLVAAGRGAIVNVASISASRGAFFMPQNAHGAAKGGVLALTYQLVIEGGPHGIRVNAVSPAMTETPHTTPLLADPAGRPRASPRGCRWAGGGSPRMWRTRSCSWPRTRPPTSAGPTFPSTAARRPSDDVGARGTGRAPAHARRPVVRASPHRAHLQRAPSGPVPAAVLLAESDADVIEGVRLAAERGWTVSVRSGGHSWAAWSLRDDALLIDLGGLRDLAYDPATGVVSVRPAVKGGQELAPYLAERGRAFPGGHCPSVGLGGFLLQGGQGWNGRAKGWACQSVAGLDVVTADGKLVHADAGENPDLLWAARGAGPGLPGWSPGSSCKPTKRPP